jgi:hypothetical protein
LIRFAAIERRLSNEIRVRMALQANFSDFAFRVDV